MKSTILEWKGVTTKDCWINKSRFFDHINSCLDMLVCDTGEGWRLKIYPFKRDRYWWK